MPDRPLILFPSPERSDRERKPRPFSKPKTPSLERQFTRLQPTFDVLRNAFDNKAIKVQQSQAGIDPEFALVFEVIGTVESFYTAVKHMNGFEWLFDEEVEPFTPDDDFYILDRKTGERTEESLDGRLYCIMSNQQAITQLLSLWQRYKRGEKMYLNVDLQDFAMFLPI